jgi:UDP-glucose 4-epimerase
MELKGSRVLITGAAGLVGSAISDQLVKEGVGEIVALDNFSRGVSKNLDWATKNGKVTLINGSINDRALLEKSMKGIDVLYHQAAIRITQCAEEPRLALEVMVDGTFNVLEAAAKAGVKKTIAASSASVYGAATQFPTPEDHPLHHNRTFYGAAKAFNEQLLRAFNEMYGMSYAVLRYFNIYGVRMSIQGRFTEVHVKWLNKIANGEPPLILGDGSTTMDFIYIDDVARANILAAKAEVSDEIFNVGSGEETNLNQLATALLKAMDSSLKPQYGPERKVNPVPRRLADTSKAKRLLGFEAKVSLEEGLKRLVDWWRLEKDK